MLDNLVESKSNAGETGRKAGFLVTTLFTVVSLFLVSLTYSLFAKDLGTNDNGLELSTLVAPVIEAETPPEPEIQKPMPKQTSAAPSNVPVRTDTFASIERTTEPPDSTKGQKGVQSWAKNAHLGTENLNPSGQSSLPRSSEPGEGLKVNNNNSTEKESEPPPMMPKPSPKPVPVEQPKKDPVMVTGGVVNGKATNLVKPQYSPAAKAVKASGAVNVQVVIDENGKVISASAVSGHQLLRKAAEDAARASKFTPTTLTGKPVKVTGVIIYNFTSQ
ncbi:MAG TPA: TonB family protein [Pyrinomonadaceae bacterium]|jgi:TonB family protein